MPPGLTPPLILNYNAATVPIIQIALSGKGLTEQALVYERVNPAGVRERWTFQPYWLRIEFDDPPQHASELRLRSRGHAVTIGAFLAPPERRDLAAALREALHKARNPAFE